MPPRLVLSRHFFFFQSVNELLVLITEFVVDSFPFCTLGLLYLLAFLFPCFLAQSLYLTVLPTFDFIYIINYCVHVWNICVCSCRFLLVLRLLWVLGILIHDFMFT